jgi:hypothetical protein
VSRPNRDGYVAPAEDPIVWTPVANVLTEACTNSFWSAAGAFGMVRHLVFFVIELSGPTSTWSLGTGYRVPHIAGVYKPRAIAVSTRFVDAIHL